MDAVHQHLATLRSHLDSVPIFQTAEETIKVPKEHIFCGLSVLVAIVVFFGVGAASLCSLIGFVYPAYKSFEAIETKVKGDDTQWLVYWVIFSFFSIIEVFADFLLYWIPFYYAFKLAFLLWAFLPQTRGAKFLYDSFLKDFLKKNESRIDAAMADAKKQAGNIANDFTDSANDVAEKVKDATAETKKDE